MSDSNRVRITSVREDTLGMTPNNPRMRTARMTGESLAYQPQFVQSAEIRSDRMNADPTKVNETNQGAVNFELSFPTDKSPMSEYLASLMFNDWVNTPSRDNDGTADSVITGVAATGGVITVNGGPAFVPGQLVKASGFGTAGNNGLFKITTGSATVPAVGGGILTDEAIPPAAARLKVVGFEGAAGDVTALVDGIGSTALDFTTLGLVPGQWLKVGAAGAGNRFATAASNGFARIAAISAHKITLDNLPTGWTADAGAGKAIRIFFGDQIRNGTTRISQTIERGFMDQAQPTFIVQRGMVVAQGEFSMASEQIITGSLTFNGMSGAQSTISLDDTPDPATTNRSMSANVDVGRVAESGAAVVGPNYIRSATINVNNNLRMITAIGFVGAVDIGVGESAVTLQLETYFGSNALLQKLLNGDVGNLNFRTAKDRQALIFSFPRVTFTDGSPSAGAKNQDVTLQLGAQASIDPLTTAQMLIDRFEYYE
jgi:hypothetical protein